MKGTYRMNREPIHRAIRVVVARRATEKDPNHDGACDGDTYSCSVCDRTAHEILDTLVRVLADNLKPA